VDLLPLENRQKLLARARKRLGATFAQTKFHGCPMVAVSAKPGTAWKLVRVLETGLGGLPVSRQHRILNAQPLAGGQEVG